MTLRWEGGGDGGSSGGHNDSVTQRKPWYMQWWAVLVGIATIVGTIFGALQYFKP